MKGRVLTIFLTILLTVAFAACCQPATPTPPLIEPATEKPAEPKSLWWQKVLILLPREIEQPNFVQRVESLTTIYSVEPDKIEDLKNKYGTKYRVASFSEDWTEIGDLIITMEAIIYRERKEEPVITSDPYPLEAIPEDLTIYTQPVRWVQSDDPAIVSLAQELSQGKEKEIDVVDATFRWVGENTLFDVSEEVMNDPPDAIHTLKNKGGNCVLISRLLTALLRAQGIPVRAAGGLKDNEHVRSWSERPYEGKGIDHAYIEIWFPSIGWVLYDLPYFPHPYWVIYGIHWKVGPGGNIYDPEFPHFYPIKTCKVVGLGNGRIKLTAQIIVYSRPE